MVGMIQSGRFAASGGAWDPDSVSGLVANWDSSVSGSITASGSPNRVSAWVDQKNGYTLAPPTTGPIWGATTQNGLNVLDFDFATATYLQIAGVTVAQPLTIFFVAKNTVPTTGGRGRVLCGASGAGFQTAHSDGSSGYRTGLVYAGGADFAKGPADVYSTSVAA
jgi:hypothetical protein